MSQPHYAIEYLGCEDILKGKSYASGDFKTAYPTATVMKLKTSNIKVSINGTTMFDVSFDDENYIPTTNSTYIFSDDCVIAVGRYVAMT